MPSTRTTIIISDLTRDQCLSVPKTIRKDVESLYPQLGSDLIEQWSELAFLSRLVIIINSEANASEVYEYLKLQHPDLKSNIHLSESIVRRHKSFDATLPTPVSPKPELYEEREPTKSDDEDNGPYFSKPVLKKTNTKILFNGLHLDTSNVAKINGTLSPMSPTITLDTAET